MGPRWLRQTLVPAFLLTVCPPTALVVWYTHTALGGSLAALVSFFRQQGLLAALAHIWGPVFFGTRTAWAIIGVFAAVELTLMRVLPGARFVGPVTANGNVPVYKANGVLAFVVTLALFCGASFGLHLFAASIVYDNFGGILGRAQRLQRPLLPPPLPEGAVRAVVERPRDQRQSRLRLLLGHRALSAHLRLGREDVHELPLRDDGLAAHPALLRGEAERDLRA